MTSGLSPGRRLLLLSPTFHGYWRSIERALAGRGYHVTNCLYDELPTLAAKVTHKLRVELPARLPGARADGGSLGFSRTAIAALQAQPWDIVLQIKGDTLTSDYWQALHEHPAKKYLWLYDEVRRTRHNEATLAQFDGIALYNHSDHDALAAGGHHTAYVPLAFDPAERPKTTTPVSDILFIGARYPSREELLVGLASRGVPVLAVGRQWSRHPVDRMRTWEWRRPAVHARRDVDRLEGYAMTAGAPAAVNLHFNQDGFTMRTFEIPGCGGVQLVDRADVSEFYDPQTEVAVFDSPEELAELARRALRDTRWTAALRAAGQRRTLAEHTFDHRIRALETLWA